MWVVMRMDFFVVGYRDWGCWNVAETLNVVVNGFRYDFGVGGIHGSINNKIFFDYWLTIFITINFRHLILLSPNDHKPS